MQRNPLVVDLAITRKLVTYRRINSTSMHQHLSPRFCHVILVSGYFGLTAVN